MRKTEWRGQECPPTYLTRNNGGQLQLIIYTDVRQEIGENEQVTYVATEITMPIGIVDYGSIVSAIIYAHYSFDQMQAIVNNYLMETDVSVLINLLQTTQNFNKLRQAMSSWLSNRDSEIVAEYNAMQEYCKYAKQLAKTIVNEFEPNPEEE